MEKLEGVSKEEITEPLEGAINYLDQVFLNKDLISDSLDEGDYEVAWKEFENLISGIETLNQLLYNIKSLLNLDYQTLKYEDRRLNEYIEQFNNFLTEELIAAMENEDYLLISDLINYELQIHLKDYQKVFIYLLNYVTELESA